MDERLIGGLSVGVGVVIGAVGTALLMRRRPADEEPSGALMLPAGDRDARHDALHPAGQMPESGEDCGREAGECARLFLGLPPEVRRTIWLEASGSALSDEDFGRMGDWIGDIVAQGMQDRQAAKIDGPVFCEAVRVAVAMGQTTPEPVPGTSVVERTADEQHALEDRIAKQASVPSDPRVTACAEQFAKLPYDVQRSLWKAVFKTDLAPQDVEARVRQLPATLTAWMKDQSIVVDLFIVAVAGANLGVASQPAPTPVPVTDTAPPIASSGVMPWSMRGRGDAIGRFAIEAAPDAGPACSSELCGGGCGGEPGSCGCGARRPAPPAPPAPRAGSCGCGRPGCQVCGMSLGDSAITPPPGTFRFVQTDRTARVQYMRPGSLPYTYALAECDKDED
jgi:hypothetical protein